MTLSVGALAHSGTLPAAGVGPRFEARWRFYSPLSLDMGVDLLPQVTDRPFAFSLVSGFVGLGVEVDALRMRWAASLRGHVGALSAFVLPSDEFAASEPGTYAWAGLSLDARLGVPLPGGWSVEGFVGPIWFGVLLSSRIGASHRFRKTESGFEAA